MDEVVNSVGFSNGTEAKRARSVPVRPGEDGQDSKDAVVSANSCPGETDSGCAPRTKMNEVFDDGRHKLDGDGSCKAFQELSTTYEQGT